MWRTFNSLLKSERNKQHTKNKRWITSPIMPVDLYVQHKVVEWVWNIRSIFIPAWNLESGIGEWEHTMLSDTCKQAFQKEEIQWKVMLAGYQLYRNQNSLHWRESESVCVYKMMWSARVLVLKEKRCIMEYLWVKFPDSNKMILIVQFTLQLGKIMNTVLNKTRQTEILRGRNSGKFQLLHTSQFYF